MIKVFGKGSGEAMAKGGQFGGLRPCNSAEPFFLYA